MKRAAIYSRRVVDPVNSVAWYAMDGFWLAHLAWPAYVATAVTLVTGAALVLLNRRAGQRMNDDLAVNAWMWMNALWVISDLGQIPWLEPAAMGMAIVGAVLLANALRPSRRQRKTLHRFRKMRVSGR